MTQVRRERNTGRGKARRFVFARRIAAAEGGSPIGESKRLERRLYPQHRTLRTLGAMTGNDPKRTRSPATINRRGIIIGRRANGGPDIVFARMLSWVRVAWRWSDLSLPFGRPWFRLTAFGKPWPIWKLWPICWQGWLVYLALLLWILGSVLVFAALGWLSDVVFYVWALPTIGIFALIVGMKMDVRLRDD
jgi:hypothetical protein